MACELTELQWVGLFQIQPNDIAGIGYIVNDVRSCDTGVAARALRCRQYWLAPRPTISTNRDTRCSQCPLMKVPGITATCQSTPIHHQQSLRLRVSLRNFTSTTPVPELEHTLRGNPPDPSREPTRERWLSHATLPGKEWVRKMRNG